MIVQGKLNIGHAGNKTSLDYTLPTYRRHPINLIKVFSMELGKPNNFHVYI